MVGAMQAILSAMEDNQVALTYPENQKYMAIFTVMPRIPSGTPYPSPYQQALKALWSDPSVQQVYHLGHTYALADNVKYFFDSVDRLYKPDYMPDDADILRCRVKSTGITETTFHLGTLTYRMFDVGGQRSERKKWIHCFEGVTAVLFLVAISGYDQCLVEDKDAMDIFKNKIRHSSIKAYFPDYEGPDDDPTEATEFFRKRFTRLNRSEHKEVYVHYTDATDTNLLRNIMASVNDIILSRNVKAMVL
ncbi:hypothetical protein BGZ65_000084 [Modicella reniformis]|uniref:Uncharacterized protein n=1 Tax=Modicella reniformis TaxID=1440133 RepID=A0A9P6MJB5_9FUNG|nr:hypothetical protein BGZ65_000084 [Modicella reniformis]